MAVNTKSSIPDKVDVLIVGSGPAGIAAANGLKGSGATVLMVDARLKIGFPLRCGELTGPSFFQLLKMEPRPGWIRCRVQQNNIILNRPKFEFEASNILSDAGIIVRTGTSVVGVGSFDGKGRDVTLMSGNEKRAVHARIIVAADGISSTTARLCGIDTRLKLDDLMSCVAYRLAGVRFEDHKRFILDFREDVRPYYYWVIPNGKRDANVGVVVTGQRGFAARRLLDAYMKNNGYFHGGRIVQTVAGSISSSMPLDKPYSDGLLVTGTAARFVNAANGAGIRHAVVSGRAAAYVIRKTDDSEPRADRIGIYRDWLEDIYKICSETLKKRKERTAGERT